MKFDLNYELKRIKEFISTRENRINFLILLIITLVIIGVLLYKGLGLGNRYVVDKSGKLIGLSRESPDEFISYPVEIEAEGQGSKIKEVVNINLRGKNVQKEKKNDNEAENELSNKVKRVIDEIGRSGEKVVILPRKIQGGISIKWARVRNYNAVILLFIPFIIMMVVYFDKRKKEIDSIIKKNEIILKSLPGFNDQLIMLLNCGLIFNDAFYTLVRSYLRKKEKDYFTKLILEIGENAYDSNRSLTHILQRKSTEIKNRWFSRMVSVIVDNQKKGVDLCEKLNRDGELIWEERKKKAIEKGKLAESKMSFPLAILLIVLIMVTALPAMLQVKGG
ncbi:MAG: type II secretion system F family protein [Hornefia sp.]|nr:type II secretion system F family protein [Hornefia sp.]